jgi:P27 family predicted phage terminase small subunit
MAENKLMETWPEPPEHLSEKAKALFSFYVGMTVRSPGQIALFIRGLDAMDRADECGQIIRAEGLSQTSERSKMTRQHPLLNTQREASAEMLKIWKNLGLHINRRLSKGGFGYENIT